MRTISVGIAMGLSVLVAAPASARESSRAVSVDDTQVRQWNNFADQLQRLHRRQLEGRTIREVERSGGYARQPDFYREVEYIDADSGQLLSRIQWERGNPERVHAIEVYVHDNSGRVARDYMAWYLPEHRNAPRQTTINLYQHGGDLTGWRQFDASGKRIYEKCQGAADRKVLIELADEDRIAEAEARPDGVAHSADYSLCFGDLPKTAGRYLTPQ
jgi:hypothetical protein